MSATNLPKKFHCTKCGFQSESWHCLNCGSIMVPIWETSPEMVVENSLDSCLFSSN